MEPECVPGAILRQAMEMELEGREFYLNAAGKVENRLGRSMLESLAKDEEGHHALLLQIQEGEVQAALGECKSGYEDGAARVRALFAEFGTKATGEIKAGTDDLEALNISMEMERRGYDLYKQAASESTDESAAKVFLFLADEEQKHFEVLQNMHRYLSDPENWFLEQEQGLLDGGD